MLDHIKKWFDYYHSRGARYDDAGAELPSGVIIHYRCRMFTWGYIMCHVDPGRIEKTKWLFAQIFTKTNHVAWRIMYLNGID